MRIYKFEPRRLDYKGVTYPSISACIRACLPDADQRQTNRVYARIGAGWTIGQALSCISGKAKKYVKRRCQNPGRSINTRVTVDGKRVSVKTLLKHSGVSVRDFHKRVARGWPVADAAKSPPGSDRRFRPTNRDRLVTAFGETHNLTEWTKIKGFTRGLIQSRLDNGWTPEEAVGIPNSRTLGRCIHPQKHGRVWHAAKEAGISISTITKRMRNGESLEEAVSRPALGRHELYAAYRAEKTARELAKLGIVV